MYFFSSFLALIFKILEFSKALIDTSFGDEPFEIDHSHKKSQLLKTANCLTESFRVVVYFSTDKTHFFRIYKLLFTSHSLKINSHAFKL